MVYECVPLLFFSLTISGTISGMGVVTSEVLS